MFGWNLFSPRTNPKRFERELSYDEQFTGDRQGDHFFKKYDPYGKYLAYLQGLSATATNAIKIYQIDSTFVNTDLRRIPTPSDLRLVQELDRIMDESPTVEHAFKCYKCYQENVTPAQINTWKTNLSYLSTTLSHKFAEEWCLNGKYKFENGQVRKSQLKPDGIRSLTRRPKPPQPNSGLVICIIVPVGSKGVLPIVLEHFENFKQNEILMHRHGSLVNTGVVDYRGYPVYVYNYQDPAIPPNPNYLDISTYKSLFNFRGFEHQTMHNTGGSRKRRHQSRKAESK